MPEDLDRLLAGQRAVAHRDQLRCAGADARDVDQAVAAGRWVTWGPVIVLADNGALDVGQLRWMAVLHCGTTAALCAWTALEAHGLRGFERDDVHVVVPRGTGRSVAPAFPPSADGVLRRLRLHESRRHTTDDVVRGRRAPVHSPARAAVDAAVWARSDRAAAGVLAATVQQRLATPSELLLALDVAGAVRRRRLVAAVVLDVAGGAQALSELDFARLCRRAGLPEPARQRRRRDGEGRWRYLDAEWVRRDGRRVVVEVDGRGHMETRTWEDDLLRQNDLSIGDGSLVLRVPATVLRTAPERVVAQLRRALAPVSA